MRHTYQHPHLVAQNELAVETLFHPITKQQHALLETKYTAVQN